MKIKKPFIISALFLTLSFYAAAGGNTPNTGERTSILPYIIGIVALVLIVALLWLSYLSKKNKK